MPFCAKCGKQLNENARFCPVCGNPTGNAAGGPNPPLNAAQPEISNQVSAQQAAAVDAFNRKFAAVNVRYRCGNGHVFDGKAGTETCPTCGAALPKGGYIQIYRMGNFMGGAVGMGIYVDGVPYGHVGNRQSVRVSVPFGTHELHMTHTATRDSSQPKFTLSPQYPYVFFKAHFTNAGFSIGIDPADPESMPER